MNLIKNKLIKKINNINFEFNKYSLYEIENILNVLDDKTKTIDYVSLLEKEFAKKFKIKYTIACNSGTSALHSAIASLELNKNDEVIVPALSVVMDAYAAIHNNAIPVFADVDPENFLINIETIKKKVTKKTKAIIAVSLQGQPVDIDPIISFAKKKGIFVIEDSAQDFMGSYKNRVSGTSGDIGIWSFENKKHLSGATEGGIIGTNSKHQPRKLENFQE